MNIYTRRRIVNHGALAMTFVATAFGLFWLGWLLFTLTSNGFRWLTPEVFTRPTPPPGSPGGLSNCIVGSLLLTGVGLLLGAPVGVLAGTYLAEFGRSSRLAAVIRFLNDILLSAPSIIVGVFIYGAVVLRTRHFSGWAGVLSLALIVIPIVVRTTENVMRLVPDSLREAGAALGAPPTRVIGSVIYRAALPGIATGVLLGLARISGETAPLLFTALNNQFWTTDLRQPFPNLPVVIFQFAMSPYQDWQRLAWAGALLITVAVLALNVLARVISRGRMSS